MATELKRGATTLDRIEELLGDNARMLLDQPAYNFDDQSEKVLPQPVQLNPGDKIRVTCTHDASLRSKLPQLKTLKPRYVVWGDGTSDEMCLAILTVTPKV